MSSSGAHRRAQSQLSSTPSTGSTAMMTGASPMRKPLHERSRSQANVSPNRACAVYTEKIYQQTPFPILPSQHFPPRPGARDYEEVEQEQQQSPPLPPKSPRRSIVSVDPYDGDETVPDVPPLFAATFPNNFSSNGVRAGRESKRRSPKAKGKERLSPSSVDLVGETCGTTNIQRKTLPASKSTIRQFDPSDSTESYSGREKKGKTMSKDDSPAVLQHKTLERIRPQSTLAPSPEITQSEISECYYPSAGRTRSVTSPDHIAEAWVQELIRSGANVQYPTIRQPSITSLKTEASSQRTAYPPPLRLQRKRATSQLNRAAGHSTSTKQTGNRSYIDQRLRPEPSKNSILTDSSLDSYGPVITDAPSLAADRFSSNWADEAGDTVPELNPPMLRRQRSDIYQQPDSPPASVASSRPGSFYNFLNDSVTAWAHYYYRNESRQRLSTPPQVTNVTPEMAQGTFRYPAGHHYFPSTQASIEETISRSQSPSLADFPETLYVRRLRPHESRYPHANEINNSQSFSINRASAHYDRYERHDSVIPASPPMTPPHNPTAPLPLVPRLSPDKRNGSAITYWRAPSLDETTRSPFSKVNRQIFLFCLGFIFPPAWWLAAILSLPQRPQWLRSSADAREQLASTHNEKKPEASGPTAEERGRMLRMGETEVRRLYQGGDMFDKYDVMCWQKARWWRNLNRGMAVLGICIIAAVIVVAVVTSH